MSLSPGKRLGSYEVLAMLGAGGMGEVYHARDSKLGREVAIKVLPPAFAQDPERLARFQREAQVLAALNHPNIAQIYGLDESEGTRFLALEYVPGETLKGPVPVEESMAICRQIAEALEAAHEKGIVHRDLKPANIKVTPEGQVKVLDFGLAKATEESPADLAHSPTMSIAATRAGMVMGTAAYMSPEQARGKPVDKRTDIWAFGCVLYELLTGKQAFGGETVTDMMAAIVTKEPDWTALPPGSPVRMLRHCLQKDSKKRLRDIGDAFQEEETQPLSTQPVPQSAIRIPQWFWLVLVAAACAAGMWWQARRTVRSPAWSGSLLTGSITAFGPRISPDGQTLAFQAMVDGCTQVAIMKPDSGNWTVLTRDRSQGYVDGLYWSPDGAVIYFTRTIESPRGIFRIPAVGGEERLVVEDAAIGGVLPDGSLLISRVNADRDPQLHRFWPETGRLQAYPAIVQPGSTFGPPMRVFPDGKEAVFYGGPLHPANGDANPHPHVLDLNSGGIRLLSEKELRANLFCPNFPVAVDNQNVLACVTSEDLFEIVAIPRSGQGPTQRLLSLTRSTYGLDASTDGSLYLDQADRAVEVLRFPVAGGLPERLAETATASGRLAPNLQFPDGRVLLDTMMFGRSRLMVFAPGKDPSPLIETKEETAASAVMLGEHEVAFRMGAGPAEIIAVAAVKDGRIVRRLQESAGKRIDSLTASPDGKTLYYVSAGSIWAMPSTGGAPRKMGSGDSISMDAGGQDLIVVLNEKERSRVVRLPLSGGPPQEIPWKSELRLTSWPLSPNAVNPDGRILVTLGSADSWFYYVGIVNSTTGEVRKVPVSYVGDIGSAGWTRDGQIRAQARPLRTAVWRFRPEAGNQK